MGPEVLDHAPPGNRVLRCVPHDHVFVSAHRFRSSRRPSTALLRKQRSLAALAQWKILEPSVRQAPRASE